MTKITRTLITAAGLAATVALPAAAQTGLCGGAGVNGQWIGGSESASDVSTTGDAMQQMALVLMQNEYVALFTVSSPTGVRMEAQGRGAGDPVIDLRNADGMIILSDDDSGGDGASRAEATLDPGTYCLSMASYDGSPMTGFVRVGRLEHEPLTPGTASPPPADTSTLPTISTNTTGPTQPPGETCDISRVSSYFAGGGAIDGSLDNGTSLTASVDQIAYHAFTLAAASPITITAENSSADPVIVLYDAAGNYLADNDDFDGLNSRIDMTSALQPGSYCIAVTALSDTALPITVTVLGFDPMAALIASYERGEASPPLDGSYPINMLGTLDGRMRQDIQTTDATTWFAFDVEVGGLVLVEAISNGVGDPIIVLYDDFGRLVTENDDYGGTLDSLMVARVLPGTYLAGVRQLNEGETGLIRMLFERYIPAK